MSDDTEFDLSQLNSRNDFRRFLEWFADDFKRNPAEWKTTIYSLSLRH
jgi:hypothetical protein